MRLSEAIMLGSATCELTSGYINSCAYGAALNAMGVPRYEKKHNAYKARYVAALKLWPWIAGFDPSAMLAQGLVPFNGLGNSVWQKFDREVCAGVMTLEQLADYVRSIEPSCGDCNRFNCNCKAQQEVSTEVEHVSQT